MVRIDTEKRNIGEQWTQENLENALRAINNNQARRKVSTTIGIPREALRRYYKSKMLRKTKHFLPTTRKILCTKNHQIQRDRLPLTSDIVRHEAYPK
ncbi:hypothetical protein JTB14_010032 [Gonioctena quinquepunctata]|nr:hypothetical protein JTB14_010032 [Gonioctena quinquepunctata]